MPVQSFGSGYEFLRTASCSSSTVLCTSLDYVTLIMMSFYVIPLERQLVFVFSDDGGELIAAEPVLDDHALVLHVDHFSSFRYILPR